jgi:choline dehydrogenase-like flavoprotein
MDPSAHKHIFSLVTTPFAPRSRGRVTIKSTDAAVMPTIQHEYLSDPLDLLVVSKAVCLGNDIVLNGSGTKDIVKGDFAQNTTSEQWKEYVKQNAMTCK